MFSSEVVIRVLEFRLQRKWKDSGVCPTGNRTRGLQIPRSMKILRVLIFANFAG